MPERDHKSEVYLFGDTELAAERLRLLAEVFAPSTREFLAQLAADDPRQVADLGCGPGHTTRLVAQMFPQANVWGLDNSDPFISLARRTPSPRVAYEVADVTGPLPHGPYDLIYCRYLLTHVARPTASLVQWAAALRPRGLVAIEENDWIHAHQPAFARYLGIVEAMLAEQGQALYVGAQLERLTLGTALVPRSSQLVSVSVSDRDAARMFSMNARTWRRQPFIQRNYSASELDCLEHDLAELAAENSSASSIEFGRRRLVLERTDSERNKPHDRTLD